MSPFDINSVVFRFDDFNYGRRITTIFFFSNCTQLVFCITYNKMKKYIDALNQLTKVVAAEHGQYKTGALKRKRQVKQSGNILK